MRKAVEVAAVTGVIAALVAVTAAMLLLCAVMVNASRHLPAGLSWPGYSMAACAGAAWLGILYIAVRELTLYLGLDLRGGGRGWVGDHTVDIDGLQVRPRALQMILPYREYAYWMARAREQQDHDPDR